MCLQGKFSYSVRRPMRLGYRVRVAEFGRLQPNRCSGKIFQLSLAKNVRFVSLVHMAVR